MADLNRTMPNPPEPVRGLGRIPENFEAVDRLMAMATEKRADRAPSSALALPPARESVAPESAGHEMAAPPALPSAPSGPTGPARAVHTAGRVLSSLRPMLPALTAALRMVDHGAVQAAARLLPLLAGLGAPANTAPANTGATNPPGLLEAGLREHRKELDELRSDLVAAEEQLTQLRWKVAQVESEQAMQTLDMAKLNKRVRLLSIAVIFLLPLVAALVVMLFITFRS